MGLFKQMKQMREVVAEAPDLIRDAQALQEAQQAQQAQSAQFAAQPMATPAAGTAPASVEPIAGVSLEAYATVSRAIIDRGAGFDVAAAVAAEHGVDAASWAAAAAGWNERLRTDLALAQRFNNQWRGVG